LAIYSIKDLEKLSGIKAHTIRIWERRYGVLTPLRTDTNIRYYQDEHLQLLLNIALLNRHGYKISKISHMSKEQISETVAQISDIDAKFEDQLDAITLSIFELDEYKFDKILSSHIQQIGFESTMFEVIYPLLDKLSLLWLSGSVNQIHENFVSQLIRQKLITAIDQIPLIRPNNNPSFLIYMPEGEDQDLSLSFLHFLLKSRKYKVMNLGSEIGLVDLEKAMNVYPEVNYLFTMVNESIPDEKLPSYLNYLRGIFPDTSLILSGYKIISQNPNIDNNTIIVKSMKETIEYLENRPVLEKVNS
jgi:DNA-binding transcriptional MerR regulator